MKAVACPRPPTEEHTHLFRVTEPLREQGTGQGCVAGCTGQTEAGHSKSEGHTQQRVSSSSNSSGSLEVPDTTGNLGSRRLAWRHKRSHPRDPSGLASVVVSV